MELKTATELMAIFERVGATLNEAEPILRALPEGERESYLTGLGSMMAMLWTGLQHPIVQEHPELDPDV
ncbi:MULTISPECIES: hypothetical protein [unclassified Duganella]|uniref:hypothetical protein n=1 Tax=unclassified Duganella TaxID=2636909 RepID=UPI0006F736B7|nr:MULTISPECIES: hypothetical protein [unclassified Duganella]KQV50983.1 hypothetical protein ASD07_08655 [Duganella sp. Root336D2]KRC00559.1 hypothetical protein ASE26_22845 [Duganella sp. Root198D2]